MQVQLWSDNTDGFRPVYAGQNRWTLPGLPGREVPTDVAVTALAAAAILAMPPDAKAPEWSVVHTAARALGLTAQQFAAALGMNCAVPDMPQKHPRPGRFGPRG